MTSFKGYANDIENETVKVKLMWSFLENVCHVLNILFFHTNNLLKSILRMSTLIQHLLFYFQDH